MRAFPAAAIAVALLAAGCGSGSRASGPQSPLSWHACGHFKCAKLSVPVSYSDPRGPQISISVIELAASRPKPLADIVLNPGGPGSRAWTSSSGIRACFRLRCAPSSIS